MQVHVPWINTYSRVTTGEPAIRSKKKKEKVSAKIAQCG